MKSINFDSVRKEYKIMLEYKGKMFRATIEYPFFYLSESGVRALLDNVGCNARYHGWVLYIRGLE